MSKSLSRPWCAYVAVLVATGIFYGISCAPGALWQDSGLIQYRLWHNDIEGFLGLAIAHPLYYIVALGAKMLPVGNFGHRVNLVSAFAGAVAVANLYLLVRLWLERNFPAIIAATTLAVSHTFWQHASMAETYTLWTALFLAEMIVLLRYSRTARTGDLYVLGLLNGLAIAVHMLAVIPGLCYAVLLLVLLGRRAIRLREAALVVVFWMVGALPYEYLIGREMMQSGDILGTLASAAFGDRWRGDVLNTHLSWQLVKENALLLVLNFPTPNAVLFLAGAVALFKMRAMAMYRCWIVALMGLFLAFAFRYTVSDRYAFFIPFYVVVSGIIGLGAHAVQQCARRSVLLALIGVGTLVPIAVYAVAPTLAVRMNLGLSTRGDVPYRDDVTFFLRPWKTGYRGAERFAREALEAVPSQAVIYADTTTVAPLLYVQEVQGSRPDVSIVTGIVCSEGAPPYGKDVFEQVVEAHPVYLTSRRPGYCPRFVLGEYTATQEGLLWRVKRLAVPAGRALDQ